MPCEIGTMPIEGEGDDEQPERQVADRGAADLAQRFADRPGDAEDQAARILPRHDQPVADPARIAVGGRGPERRDAERFQRLPIASGSGLCSTPRVSIAKGISP